MNVRTRGVAVWGSAVVLAAGLAVLVGCAANVGTGGTAEQQGSKQPVKTTGGWRMARMTFKVGSGSKVSITGGGEGTSNCTKDETVTSFTTKSSEEAHDFGFYAKTDGACDILEKSYSYFNVVVKESNDSTVGSARVYFGQGPVGSVTYNISCSAETGRITCERDREGVTISRK